MKLSTWDRFTLSLAPAWTMKRLRARAAAEVYARHYEAASTSRRTVNWNRSKGDVNAVIGVAAAELRTHARDLIRNNAWARRGQRVIANNTVGWGIVPKPAGDNATANAKAAALWKRWADSTECEAEGRHTFYGLQQQVIKAVAESGEVLVRRRWRLPTDGLTVPLQLQILEAEHLDTAKDGETGPAGGKIVQGVEFDKLGRRAAYWLFAEHPGSSNVTGALSRRVPASEIAHVFYTERPGQVRGVSWYGSAIVNLKDLDEYEDAELMKQKIAACFAAFVTDTDGTAPLLGEEDASDELVETLEPGMISRLRPGQEVQFGTPPNTTADTFAPRHLRRIAAGLGVTYEDLTGDYSNVNFSSARMARLSHQANVHDWRYNMMIPAFCSVAWGWFAEAAQLAGEIPEPMGADWIPPPLPMLEPDREGLAYQRLIRVGAMTVSEMIREQGGDPEQHLAEYAADMKRLDALGVKLDSDVRAVSQAGLTQERAGLGDKPEPTPEPTPEEKET